MFLNFFKNRKSRKQLLQEIEELKAERDKYFREWNYESNSLASIKHKIIPISATCVSHYSTMNEEKDKESIINCLCYELSKEIMQYISLERYVMVGEPWNYELKHIATIKVLEE